MGLLLCLLWLHRWEMVHRGYALARICRRCEKRPWRWFG